MLRAEATTADLTIAAATTTDPIHARAALTELLRREQAENERIVAGICHLLRYAGERDGKVPAPLLRRLVVGEGT